jgi:hypothetical protein
MNHRGAQHEKPKTDGLRRATRASAPAVDRWSARVTRESNALDLEAGVFRKGDARAVARSLKRSAVSRRGHGVVR